MKREKLVGWVGVLLLVGTAGIAQAAPAYYYNDPAADRAAFQAAAGSLTTESFEDAFAAASSVSFPVGGPQAFTASISTGTLSLRNDLPARFASDGVSAMCLEEGGTKTVTFTFDAPITAFGLAVNDMNFGTMSFADDLGNSLPDVLLGDTNNNTMINFQFFGVTNTTAFSSVQLAFASEIGGTIALDYLQYSGCSTIPAPGAAWLVGSGLVCLLRWRRKTAA